MEHQDMNGKPQSRIGDLSSGHWVGPYWFPPTPLVTGSVDTFSCYKQSCRITDVAEPHFAWLFGVIPLPFVIHVPTAVSGSTTKLINHLSAFRMGDDYDCGDTQLEGCILELVGD